jgi:hypothetical protein
MWVTKNQKKSFLDWLEGCICSKHLSAKTNGIMIRSLHMNLPVLIILILCFGSKWMVVPAILFVATIVAAFLVFSGCVLSILENRLCQDDFNICDPVLEYYSIETTNKNRTRLSNPVMVLYLMVSLGIVAHRFC